MKLSKQDQIWNRAALEAGGSSPGVGDLALTNLLSAHGLVMNGGVQHTIECMSRDELADSIAGFKYFGFFAAANVLSQPSSNLEDSEESLNSAYSLAVPDDSTLVDAFHIKLLATPDAFSAIVPESQG
jgi:hypothetical protein